MQAGKVVTRQVRPLLFGVHILAGETDKRQASKSGASGWAVRRLAGTDGGPEPLGGVPAHPHIPSPPLQLLFQVEPRLLLLRSSKNWQRLEWKLHAIEKVKQQRKINKSQTWVFGEKKSMKWANLYLVWPREKERRFKILDRITNEREDLTTDLTEIRKITKECYGQLYSHKVDSCHEIDT